MSEAAAPAAPVSQPATSAPADPNSAPIQATSAPKSTADPEVFEVKVNGRIVKMSRQELIDNASMSHAAVSKFEEAKKARAEADKIISRAKSNPIEALIEAGLSKEQVRDAMEKWYTTEFIEPESLNADQKARREAEIKLKKYQEQEEAQKAKDAADEEARLTTAQREGLQKQIIEALETSGLPVNKFVASRMAFYMRQNLMRGFEAPTSLIVKHVKDEYNGLVSGLGQSTPEQVIALLGDDFMNKLRKFDLEGLRKKRQIAAQNPNVTQMTPKDVRISGTDVNSRLNHFRRFGEWPKSS